MRIRNSRRSGRTVVANCRVTIAAAPILITLVMVLCCCCSRTDAALFNRNPLPGNDVVCRNEGERISIAEQTNGTIPDDPCLSCKCDRGRVSCERQQCASVSTCAVLERRDPNQCCSRCKRCNYAGFNYEDGARWPSSQEKCRVFTCKAGVTTMSKMLCEPTTCSEPKIVRGYCCPVCPIATNKDQDLLERALATVDPCRRCDCKDNATEGSLCQCYRTACPVLDCAPERQRTPPGACCPECVVGKAVVVDTGPLPAGRCLFRGAIYKHETNFRPGTCDLCKCQDGHVICRSFTCKTADCAKQRLYFVKGFCCPFCRDSDPLPCTSEGVAYSHGERWALDLCTRCECRNGETKCTTKQCPPSVTACQQQPGYRLRRIPGQCCPVCEEKEATCTVFGDPHYETFDGRKYSFHGTCRYTLVDHCLPFGGGPKAVHEKKQFKVIVKNKPHGTKARTHHVTVIIPITNGNVTETVRIKLLPRKKVKVNRRVVSLPHLRFGRYVISTNKRNNVVFRLTAAKLKVEWDGYSFVQVTLPPEYRGKLCGLCGDYDGGMKNDFRTSFGTRTTSRFVFAQSWRYGPVRRCERREDRRYRKLLRGTHINEVEKKLLVGWDLINRQRPPTDDSYRRLRPDFVRSMFDHLRNATTQESEQQSTTFVKPQSFRKRSRWKRLCPNDRWRSRMATINQCKLLLESQSVAECRGQPGVNTRRFFNRCVRDACACPPSGSCHCDWMRRFAEKCRQQDWLSDTKCRLDAKGGCSATGSYFDWCGGRCPVTCADVNQTRCSRRCTPGCRCADGLLIHNGRCIPQSLCPASQ